MCTDSKSNNVVCVDNAILMANKNELTGALEVNEVGFNGVVSNSMVACPMKRPRGRPKKNTKIVINPVNVDQSSLRSLANAHNTWYIEKL